MMTVPVQQAKHEPGSYATAPKHAVVLAHGTRSVPCATKHRPPHREPGVCTIALYIHSGNCADSLGDLKLPTVSAAQKHLQSIPMLLRDSADSADSKTDRFHKLFTSGGGR